MAAASIATKAGWAFLRSSTWWTTPVSNRSTVASSRFAVVISTARGPKLCTALCLPVIDAEIQPGGAIGRMAADDRVEGRPGQVQQGDLASGQRFTHEASWDAGAVTAMAAILPLHNAAICSLRGISTMPPSAALPQPSPSRYSVNSGSG